MKQFLFKKIDAFTTGGSPGNPAGCVHLHSTDDITPDEMQRLAAELKGFVNETVFLFPEKESVYVRYYSSECEVDFCGHGTIAAMYDCIQNTPALLEEGTVQIRVKDEILTVYNRIREDNSVHISAPLPKYPGTPLTADIIAEALGVETIHIPGGLPVDMVNGGLNTLLVPVDTLECCTSILPDIETLKNFCIQNDIDIILVFTGHTAAEECRYRTRVFAPKFGYLEDPATGSGNSAFGYYLMKENLWDGTPLVIEQGQDIGNPNIIRLGTTGTGDARQVTFGGSAVVRIKGRYILHGAQ
ncbi:MAG TPA: PhzF family phenazine biosynthesis protein [Spirochaetota bacterium]|nr:PhzF family phenazine biosynthesis protein [Spirochaetota bacterium]